MPDSTEKTPEDTIATPNAEPLGPEAAASASAEASASEPAISLQVQLEEAQAKVKAWEEEYLRARAEMENLRKRSAQEVLNAGKFAIEGFAEALLPVADSLKWPLPLSIRPSTA